jgi:tetratricopeptide (TPR) repeat protein
MNWLILTINIFLVFTFFSKADTVDSLKAQLDETEGKERISVIINLMMEIERINPEEAITYANEGLKYLDINPDKELEAELFYRKGWAYYYLHENDSAKYFADLTGKVSASAGFVKGMVMKYLLTARILRTDGAFEDALLALDAAEEENREAEDDLLQIKILNERGSVYRRLSRNDDAYEMHTKALELLEKLNNTDELTSTYTYLGIISDIKGNYDKAIQYHHKALKLNKEENDLRGTAGSIHNIGILYQKIEKYDEALNYYNQAMKLWEELDNKDGLAATLNSLGAVNELTGNQKQALYYYQRALEIWEKSGSKYSLSIALNNIGSIHEYLGNFNEAIKYLKRAIVIREELRDKNGNASSLIVLAAVYNKMGKYQEAVDNAKKGLTLAEEVGAWTSIREAHSVLSDIYENNGNYKEALDEYKKYKAAHDTLFNSESQANIAEIQEKYKSEEQKKQIELLQKESEIQNLYRTILIAGLIFVLIILFLLYNRYRLKQKAANLRTEAAETKAAIIQKDFELKKKELEAARELQLSMLPSKIPEHPDLQIAALMNTATEVGGDYYDFHSSNGSLTIAIGDATGHGAQAGLMVAAAKSLFNLLANEKDVSEILSQSTHSIRRMNFPNIFMALGILRYTNGKLELAGAGMPPAYIFR